MKSTTTEFAKNLNTLLAHSFQWKKVGRWYSNMNVKGFVTGNLILCKILPSFLASFFVAFFKKINDLIKFVSSKLFIKAKMYPFYDDKIRGNNESTIDLSKKALLEFSATTSAYCVISKERKHETHIGKIIIPGSNSKIDIVTNIDRNNKSQSFRLLFLLLRRWRLCRLHWLPLKNNIELSPSFSSLKSLKFSKHWNEKCYFNSLLPLR